MASPVQFKTSTELRQLRGACKLSVPHVRTPEGETATIQSQIQLVATLACNPNGQPYARMADRTAVNGTKSVLFSVQTC